LEDMKNVLPKKNFFSLGIGLICERPVFKVKP